MSVFGFLEKKKWFEKRFVHRMDGFGGCIAFRISVPKIGIEKGTKNETGPLRTGF
jgi:hypothetical protein